MDRAPLFRAWMLSIALSGCTSPGPSLAERCLRLCQRAQADCDPSTPCSAAICDETIASFSGCAAELDAFYACSEARTSACGPPEDDCGAELDALDACAGAVCSSAVDCDPFEICLDRRCVPVPDGG